MFLSGASGLGATSKGTKINLINNTKFYDWKDYTQLDTSTLIQIQKGVDEQIKELLFKNFDVANIIRSALVGDNARYIYEIDEPKLNDKGEPIVENGIVQTKTVEYVHGGIAFYGGGKNYSAMINTIEELSSLKLNELSGIALTGIITSFSGNEPFKFYMYDRFSDITPNSSPDINDLREFYSEYETSFSSY